MCRKKATLIIMNNWQIALGYAFPSWNVTQSSAQAGKVVLTSGEPPDIIY